jgi:hypothetical protein
MWMDRQATAGQSERPDSDSLDEKGGGVQEIMVAREAVWTKNRPKNFDFMNPRKRGSQEGRNRQSDQIEKQSLATMEER